jgi:hypothetical protein
MVKKKLLKTKKPRIKRVVLDKSTVLHVEVPEDVTPVVAHHPDKVVIAPARKDEEVGWWDYLFGTEKKTI